MVADAAARQRGHVLGALVDGDVATVRVVGLRSGQGTLLSIVRALWKSSAENVYVYEKCICMNDKKTH